MAEQKLIISSTTPDGLDASKTISNINPDASNEQLAQLGQKLTALTDNTYGKTDRVVTYNCDTESGGAAKTQATITLEKTTDTKTNVMGSAYSMDSKMLSYPIAVTYNGDGRLFFSSSSNYIGVTYGEADKMYLCSYATIDVISGLITEDVTITVRAEETDNYTAAEATFTVTV